MRHIFVQSLILIGRFTGRVVHPAGNSSVKHVCLAIRVAHRRRAATSLGVRGQTDLEGCADTEQAGRSRQKECRSHPSFDEVNATMNANVCYDLVL
jgi:hypothetical protein